MADERAKRDENQVPVGLAVENNAGQEIRMLRVDPNTGGALSYPCSDYFSEVALGNIEGVTIFPSQGFTTDVVTTGFTDVWEADVVGGFVYPSGAVSLEVVSSDANDTSAGSGARTVLVTTLNASGVSGTQTVTLNGTSAVALTGTHTRINGMLVTTSAARKTSNAGTITIRVASAGAVWGVIKPGKGTMFNSHYSIPSNMFGVVHRVDVLTEKDQEVVLRNKISIAGTGTFVSGGELPSYQSQVGFDLKTAFGIPPGTDVFFEAKSLINENVSVTVVSQLTFHSTS